MAAYAIELNERIKYFTCPHCGEKSATVWGSVSPTVDSFEMMVREPEESLYFGKKLLGRGLSRSEALASEHREDFFAVADCIAFNDPAVKSYLSGKSVSTERRQITN